LPADLAAHLLRKGIRSITVGLDRCSGCRRSPLPGEVLHVYDQGSRLCALCRAERAPGGAAIVRLERVGIDRQRLTVTPHAP
jgi:CRISPR/Cas system-associated protein Cas10 (large subunit of type III CRISPR-Cas system)